MKNLAKYLGLFFIGLSVIATFITAIVAFKQSANLNSRASETTAVASMSFVTRTGPKLFLDGKEFKIAGANLYWLGLDDNVGGVDYPTKFRITDGLSTAHTMGVNVVRAHTLGISTGCEKCIEPRLNVFNDTAFDSIDYAIKTAKDNNIKLIIPLTDQWHYYHGGKHNFTDWRGVPEDTFHSNPVVIQDFKNYISHVLNHVNSYTGTALKDDPTIMAWETGNELFTIDGSKWSESWTENIAEYIKTIAPHQLVADGRVGNSEGSHLLDSSLDNPAIDMMADHHYPPSIADLTYDANRVMSHNKVFYIGEFDWTGKKGGDSLDAYLKAVETTGIAGDMFWTLLPKLDGGGYETHGDGYTLHYPGDDDNMKSRVKLLSDHFARLTGSAPIAPITPPGTLSIDDSIQGTSVNQFSYNGSGWQHCSGCGAGLYNQTTSYSSTGGDYATIQFTGTQIKYYGEKDTHHGIAAVSIDNGPETRIDLYATSRLENQVLWSNSLLSAGNHTFKLRVTGEKNSASTGVTVPVDRIDVIPNNAVIGPTSTIAPTQKIYPTATIIPTSRPPSPTIPQPTATPRPTASPTPIASGLCNVKYTVNSQWSDGFNITVAVQNNTNADINGWTLEWDFPGDQKISGMWYASFTQNGQHITVKNPDYNTTIKKESNNTFGFNGSYKNTNATPNSFTLNGMKCSIN